MSRKGWYVMGGLAGLAVAVSVIGVIRAPVAQAEAGGLAQKIFYYHVGSALVMYLAYFVGFVSCILYLRRPEPRWDRLAATHHEVGLVFCTLVLITGPLWARPVWGTWWRWEPRLVTFLILWLTYVVYFIFRRAMEHPRQRARLSAVYGVLAFVNIPLVVMSTRLWKPEQQLHPQRVGLSPAMLWTLLLSFVALALVYLVLARLRYRLALAEEELANGQAEGAI